MQPSVQNLDQIYAELNPAFAQQSDILNKQRSTNAATFSAQRTGLDAAKVQGFNQINNQATGRGLSFSGIPIDEQADYLSTKYLPGMQQLTSQENDANLQIDKALAGLDSERRLKAMDIRQQQQSVLDSYLAAERQRQFEAEQNRLARAAQAAQQQRSAAPTLTKNKAGGWVVSDPNMDLAGYARATGTDLITLLSQGDAQDQKAAKYYRDNIRLGRGEQYAMDRLMNYDRKTAFYRGG